MSRGEGLAQALEAEREQIPSVYRAVVEAGLRAGRLPAALEGLAGFLRGFAETRRAIGLALGYPLLVLVVAYAVFLLFVVEVVPRFEAMFATFRLPALRSLAVLSWLGATAIYWGPVVPALLFVGALAWVRSGSAVGLRPGRARWLLRAFPWMRALLANSEAANVADLLALLIGQGVPYPEALRLAAEATGEPALARAGRDFANRIEQGTTAADALAAMSSGPNAFPPLLRWLLATGDRQGNLAGALRDAAAMYRRRALNQAQKIRVMLPVVLLFAIGATATLFYTLMLFLPLTSLLKELAVPS
jgi:general secretion pathway protein F